MEKYPETSYWRNFMKEWIVVKDDKYTIKPDAPERVKKSFAMWLEANPHQA